MSVFSTHCLKRSGKAGVFIILLLAMVAGGAVYWFKFREPQTPAPAQQPSTTAAKPSQTTAKPSAPSAGTDTPSVPTGPRSIFEDGPDGPTSSGATPPPAVAPTPGLDPQKLRSLEAARSNAATALEAARAKARLSPAFASRRAEVDELEAQLKEARKTGTPQEKISLSSQWNKARLSLKADEEKAVENDPAVLRAKAALEQAEKSLRQFRDGK